MMNVKTGIGEISQFGLGTMYFGSKVDTETSLNLLNLYFEKGGRFLDTANKYASWIEGYMGGESESTIGQWLHEKKCRQEILISTKVGFSYGDIPRSLNKKIIISECEKSLQRLKTDYIDIYFAHCTDEITPAEETMEAFYLLHKQGKIKHAGASNFFSWQLEKYNHEAIKTGFKGFAALQQRYSYFQPVQFSNFGNQVVLTEETCHYCLKKGIPLLAYSPLLGGAYLSGNIYDFPKNYQSEINKQRLNHIHSLSEKYGISPVQIVLQWLTKNELPTIPLVTASKIKDLCQCLDSLEIIIPDILLLGQDDWTAGKAKGESTI